MGYEARRSRPRSVRDRGVFLEDAEPVRPAPTAPVQRPEVPWLAGVKPRRTPLAPPAFDLGIPRGLPDIEAASKLFEVAHVHRGQCRASHAFNDKRAIAVKAGPAMALKLLVAEALPAVRPDDGHAPERLTSTTDRYSEQASQ